MALTDHQKALAEALAQILDQIEIEDERHHQKTKGRPIRATSFREILERPDDMDDFIDSPLGMALRAGVRKFGERLFKIVDYDVAHEISEVAAECRGRYGHRADVVDKRWSGLVSKDGGIWVA